MNASTGATNVTFVYVTAPTTMSLAASLTFTPSSEKQEATIDAYGQDYVGGGALNEAEMAAFAAEENPESDADAMPDPPAGEPKETPSKAKPKVDHQAACRALVQKMPEAVQQKFAVSFNWKLLDGNSLSVDTKYQLVAHQAMTYAGDKSDNKSAEAARAIERSIKEAKSKKGYLMGKVNELKEALSSHVKQLAESKEELSKLRQELADTPRPTLKEAVAAAASSAGKNIKPPSFVVKALMIPDTEQVSVAPRFDTTPPTVKAAVATAAQRELDNPSGSEDEPLALGSRGTKRKRAAGNVHVVDDDSEAEDDACISLWDKVPKKQRQAFRAEQAANADEET